MTTVPVRIIWPIGFADAIRAEATGRLPVDVEHLINAAYARGVHDGMRRLAADQAEIRILGGDADQRARDDALLRLKRERDAVEERAAFANRARNIAAGRHPDWVYRGQAAGGSGCVDWETGYPVETVEAWQRRQQMHVIQGDAS